MVALALVAVMSAGAHAMFRVQGVVTAVDNNNITVANFFRSQTIDLSGASVNIDGIKPGDKIRIQKNLQGNVLYVTSFVPGQKPGFGPAQGWGHGDSHEREQGRRHEDGRR
ncbi:MAG: hypothetical protein H6Q71_1998 [Firmicutes bacterium]|nr:hypothetical protein [Bacillota bacterium]